MQIIDFEKEFVERTKIIIESELRGDFYYEVTLLINCLLGLVSLPTEMTARKEIEFMEAYIKKLEELGVKVDNIEKNEDKRRKQIFRTIKNAVSHFNMEVLNKYGDIDRVVFRDREYKDQPYHTELIFDVSQLKEIALFVADKHLERFK